MLLSIYSLCTRHLHFMPQHVNLQSISILMIYLTESIFDSLHRYSHIRITTRSILLLDLILITLYQLGLPIHPSNHMDICFTYMKSTPMDLFMFMLHLPLVLIFISLLIVHTGLFFSIHPYTLLAIQLITQSTQYEIPVTFTQSQLRYQPNTLGTYIRPLLQCLLNPMIPVPEVITTSRNILAPPLVRPTPTFYTVRAHHVTTVMTYLRQSLNLKRSQSSAFENLFTGQIDIQPLWTRQGFYESYFKITLSYSNFYQCIQQYQDSPLIETIFFELRPLMKFVPEIRNTIIDDLIRSSTSCSCHRSMFSQSAIACDKIFFSPPCFHPHSSPPTVVVIHGIIATHSAKSSYPRRFPHSETDHVASVCTFSLKHYSPPDEASFPCYHDRSILSTRPNPVSVLSKIIHNRPFPPLCNPQLRMFL